MDHRVGSVFTELACVHFSEPVSDLFGKQRICKLKPPQGQLIESEPDYLTPLEALLIS